MVGKASCVPKPTADEEADKTHEIVSEEVESAFFALKVEFSEDPSEVTAKEKAFKEAPPPVKPCDSVPKRGAPCSCTNTEAINQ